mmetsp:Transcript_12002/g.38204  ORF Transcript_12002/g.38204 Transcript_12002/m.38204 type:complete len:228 (-) Transcript_12002:865-1548(-)
MCLRTPKPQNHAAKHNSEAITPTPRSEAPSCCATLRELNEYAWPDDKKSDGTMFPASPTRETSASTSISAAGKSAAKLPVFMAILMMEMTTAAEATPRQSNKTCHLMCLKKPFGVRACHANHALDSSSISSSHRNNKPAFFSSYVGMARMYATILSRAMLANNNKGVAKYGDIICRNFLKLYAADNASKSQKKPSSADCRHPPNAATRAPDFKRLTPIEASMPAVTG